MADLTAWIMTCSRKMRLRILLLMSVALLAKRLARRRCCSSALDWRYLKGSQTPGDWRAADFDDSAWPSGPRRSATATGRAARSWRTCPAATPLFICDGHSRRATSADSVCSICWSTSTTGSSWINGKLVTGPTRRAVPLATASGTHESGQFEPFEIRDPGVF